MNEQEKLIDILREQIKALEVLNRYKEEQIHELESRANQTWPRLYGPGTVAPGHGTCWVTPSCAHEYPTHWGGTSSPSCIKCGMPAYMSSVINNGAGGTISTSIVDDGFKPHTFPSSNEVNIKV